MKRFFLILQLLPSLCFADQVWYVDGETESGIRIIEIKVLDDGTRFKIQEEGRFRWLTDVTRCVIKDDFPKKVNPTPEPIEIDSPALNKWDHLYEVGIDPSAMFKQLPTTNSNALPAKLSHLEWKNAGQNLQYRNISISPWLDGIVKVIGELKNNRSEHLDIIFVQIGLYDETNTLLGTTTASLNNLEAKDSKSFECFIDAEYQKSIHAKCQLNEAYPSKQE